MIYWLTLFHIYLLSFFDKAFSRLLIVLILLIMSAMIAPDVSHDFQNYFNGYYSVKDVTFPEPFSRLIFSGANILGLPISFSFAIIAFITTIIKYQAVKKLGLPIGLFFLLYFGKLFLLLDLTQVRAAVAVSLCLLSFNSYVNKKCWSAILYIFVAFCFHLSSIMFIIVFFMGRNKPNISLWIFAISSSVFVSFIDVKSYLLSLMIFLHAPTNYFSYINDSPAFKVNPLNVLSLINLFVFVGFCCLNNALNNAKTNVAFKLYGVSIIAFYFFIDFPVLSFRISEFFFVYQIILLCDLKRLIKHEQQWLYLSIMMIYSGVQLYMTYNSSAIIEPYRMILF